MYAAYDHNRILGAASAFDCRLLQYLAFERVRVLSVLLDVLRQIFERSAPLQQESERCQHRKGSRFKKQPLHG